jgi:hypothetical protein
VFKTVAVERLPVGGRLADKEVEELDGLGVARGGPSRAGKYDQVAQAAQGRHLRIRELVRRRIAYRIRGRGGQLRHLLRDGSKPNRRHCGSAEKVRIACRRFILETVSQVTGERPSGRYFPKLPSVENPSGHQTWCARKKRRDESRRGRHERPRHIVLR